MGYVHETHMSQYIPPSLFHRPTGTWTTPAGQVAGTIVEHVAAADQTGLVNIPILIPSCSMASVGHGAYLTSIEIDYEILTADCDAFTFVINKVTRGADTAVAVVAAQTFTQTPTAANAKTTDQHKAILTITTPFWLDNDEYVLVEVTVNQALTTTVDFLGAVANYTLRV
jgi:hypothetical protein